MVDTVVGRWMRLGIDDDVTCIRMYGSIVVPVVTVDVVDVVVVFTSR